LMVSFAAKKLFSVMQFHLFLFLPCVLFMPYAKTLLRPMLRRFSAMFSSYSSPVADLTINSFIYFELTFMYFCKGKVQFHSSVCRCWWGSLHDWRDYPSPIGYSWQLCGRLVNKLFLGSIFCSIYLCINFYASTVTILATIAL
jgi:hypothetical protein